MPMLAVGHRRTGACPTFDRPVQQRDGYLLRVPLVGGTVTPVQANAIAEVASTMGNGVVELTNRGNLQLRGLRPETLGPAQERLRSLGLGDPRAALVTISPFAGPVEHALRARVVDALGPIAGDASLSPKFVVHIDDASATTSSRRAEVTLRSTGDTWRVEIPLVGWCDVTADDAVRTVVALAEACRSFGDEARVGDVLDACGPGWLHAVLPVELGPTSSAAAATRTMPRPGDLLALAGGPAVVVAARFGRVDSEQLGSLAALGLDLTVTPWRSFLVPCPSDGVPPRPLVDRLAGIGLIVDPADPAADVVTCIGAAGCWQTEADTLVEAERVVALRASGAAVAGPIKAGGESDTSTGTIHVTGCDKRCATRGPVATTFIGRTDGSGFDEVASRARATFT